jgi:hypothetical protein
MSELKDIEAKLSAMGRLQGFTLESLIAYAVAVGAITPQELREYLKKRERHWELK